MNRNAHRFGFIVRYQAGKEHITGYQPEAWHLRYVGSNAATEIYNSGLTLDEYLNQ
ncbi:D-alanyl-D-alanine carboxypeptidase family protein [Erysipelothrix piscisicarius]|uniref:M15 family metallopeptidase n=1 Tax=Erysipelothrix piscisicarius TaxID=2485784 RepID=UPI002F936627